MLFPLFCLDIECWKKSLASIKPLSPVTISMKKSKIRKGSLNRGNNWSHVNKYQPDETLAYVVHKAQVSAFETTAHHVYLTDSEGFKA